MALDRSANRDVYIYAANDPTQNVLGGLVLTNGVTNKVFHSMIEILIICQGPISLHDENNVSVVKDDQPLRPGNYYIAGSFSVTDELVLTRTVSVASGTRLQSFRDAVRARDGRCVITQERVTGARHITWRGFEAAHIFPLAYQGYWDEQNFSRWITLSPSNKDTVNSTQNGLLLRADIHILFDNYDLSINPDDDYKIVCFEEDGKGIAGTHFDQKLLDHPARPVDELLRWHFRQAVLTNMRGAGEPSFETDFPPGSDAMGEILSGPKAGARMEFELFSRLAVHSYP